jgi:ribosomal protein S18 acetylase RimI-like enzyme
MSLACGSDCCDRSARLVATQLILPPSVPLAGSPLEALKWGPTRGSIWRLRARQERLPTPKPSALFFRHRVPPVITRRADLADAEEISNLLTANSVGRGGALVGDWSVAALSNRLETAPIVVIAVEAGGIIGVLLTAEKDQPSSREVTAMLVAWPGDADAYVYGPVCIDPAYRGHGVLEALYAALLAHMPAREGILFINRKNTRSIRAHTKLGMQEVASFRCDDEDFLVLRITGSPAHARAGRLV